MRTLPLRFALRPPRLFLRPRRVDRQDFGHRRASICDRLQEFAARFAVEVPSYAVMSNHLHVVAHKLPGRASAWSDEEVARR